MLGSEASSSAAKAAFSAFLRAASSCFALAASLGACQLIALPTAENDRVAYAFDVSLEPLDHSLSSTAAAFAFSADFLFDAVSAFRA